MKWLASLGGVGFLAGAPGTYGSLLALPLAYGIHLVGGFWLLLALTIAAAVGGLISCRQLWRSEDSDPSWIVIDELVGQWIALFPVSYGAAMMSLEPWRLWPGWLAAFLLFRLFDIWKPWPVNRADALGTPLGIMLDDVLAGVLAAVGVIVLAALYHGVIM
jgi:phosphatidylglycerophosphatase A